MARALATVMRGPDERQGGDGGGRARGGDLFGESAAQTAPASRPAPAGAARMTRSEIVARYGVVDLKSPQAHRCFRCDAETGLCFGDPRRGVVFACRAHIGEL